MKRDSKYVILRDTNLKTRILIATDKNIKDIVNLRVEMQVEDWNKTLRKDYAFFSEEFAQITKKYLDKHLNQTIFFAILYIENKPIAMAGIEQLIELPQITVCTSKKGRHCSLVSVYTVLEYRGNGYQQQVIAYLLKFAKAKGYTDITLTTNTPDAIHIYEKFGFKYISEKYFLSL